MQKNVIVLQGKFDWKDIGGWDEVYEISDRDKNDNIMHGKHVLKDVTGCLIDSPNKMIAAVGIRDLIIVDTGDALLVCPRNKAHQVKNIVESIKRKKMFDYL